MRIAVLASNFLPIPPIAGKLPFGFSGAAERITHELVERLVDRGIDVTLFASGDSQTRAKLVSVRDTASAGDPEVGIAYGHEMEYVLISKCYQMAATGAFDVIHAQHSRRVAYFTPFAKIPTVSTLHSPLSPKEQIVLSHFERSQWYVSISNSQRKPMPQLNYAATIYHGIDPDLYPVGTGEGGNMLWTGRITREKGVLEALALSKLTRKPLAVVGEAMKDDPYGLEIKNNTDPTYVKTFGWLDRQRLLEFYQQAKLFLFPIKWEEPFGLVLIEAMASGTPVVAFARGSVPEVIADGESGFIVNESDDDKRGNWVVKRSGTEGLREAIERVYALSSGHYQAMRVKCRERVEKFFTLDRMASAYEELYKRLAKLDCSP